MKLNTSLAKIRECRRADYVVRVVVHRRHATWLDIYQEPKLESPVEEDAIDKDSLGDLVLLLNKTLPSNILPSFNIGDAAPH